MYNAARWAQKPLPQPSYRFSDAPKPRKDLRGSSVQYVNDREHFHAAMGEMLLLCKEAIRRRPCKRGTGGKPLSLEYLADRLDVDDPIWGYLVRSEEGMLQGFITVTTFTNYQRTFRWDSQNQVAFSFDDEEMEIQRLKGERKWDEDGSLARELEATVRCGDIWNEGIVWPRIAEISLLGGLGCGRALVSLVIEQLERMKATANHNYDYVILQATDNSIPFYESMGFVRVGGVMKDEVNESISERRPSVSSCSSSDEIMAEPVEEGSPEKPNALASPCDIVTSPLTSYTTQKAGETLNDVAKKLKVDVWDIIFLNKDIYKEIGPGSRLLEGTVLHIPVKADIDSKPAAKRKGGSQDDMPQWYVAKENETPRSIARTFEVNCLELVEANKARLPGLMSNSRLKDGTRIKVSHLHIIEENLKPYAHWAFPDAEFEEGEPSYMMALKLDRRKGAAAKIRPFEESMAVKISDYQPTPLLLPPSPAKPPSLSAAKALVSSVKRRTHPDEPKPPKRPPSAYMIFANQQREVLRRQLEGMSIPESSKFLGEHWRKLSGKKKARFEAIAEEARATYRIEKEEYQKELAAFLARQSTPEVSDLSEPVSAIGSSNKSTLFNKVVRLKPGAITEGTEYTYWYVLTFIPDLKWCHLAPLTQSGTFGPDKPKSQGRPKWKLVDEKLGHEVDISSSFCIPIKARTMKRTLDADREEWDIIDDGSDPLEARAATPRVLARGGAYDSDYSSASEALPIRTSSAIKPSAVERKRKRASTRSSGPPLIASLPGSKAIIFVRLTGRSLTEFNSEPAQKRGRGRPKGSKNKPKALPVESDVGCGATPQRKGHGFAKGSIKSKTSPPESLTIVRKTAKKGRGQAQTSKSKLRNSRPRPSKKVERLHTGSVDRPRRKAAPAILDDSPVPERVSRKASVKRGQSQTPLDSPIVDRPRRRAAPSFLGESPSSERVVRKVSVKQRQLQTSVDLSTPERGQVDSSRHVRPGRASAPVYLGESPPARQAKHSLRQGNKPRGSPSQDEATPISERYRNRSNKRETPGKSPVANLPTSARKTRRQNAITKEQHVSDSPTLDFRPKRKAAPQFLGENVPRKRRKVNSVGSRRSVLQN